MTYFRTLLVIMWLGILVVTFNVIANSGLDFITTFFTPIFAMSDWQGQFNFDFSLYVILSGVWMAWRSGFKSYGIALGLLAPFGMFFFAPYLLYLTLRHRGDFFGVLLGVHAGHLTKQA